VAGDAAASGPHDRLVFSAARELLANAAKHSRAKRVQVRLLVGERLIVLVVSDDGVGFEPDSQTGAIQEGHIGLQSIAERVEAVGGCLQVSSSRGHGTRVTVELPTALDEDSASHVTSGDDPHRAKLASVSEN
jgi:two-component system NarL family sensor kinase